VPHIDWQKPYEAAMLEMNPDELVTRIEAAAGHRSTRVARGYSRTRASQVGGCPFNAAQEFEQNCAARGSRRIAVRAGPLAVLPSA